MPAPLLGLSWSAIGGIAAVLALIQQMRAGGTTTPGGSTPAPSPIIRNPLPAPGIGSPTPSGQALNPDATPSRFGICVVGAGGPCNLPPSTLIPVGSPIRPVIPGTVPPINSGPLSPTPPPAPAEDSIYAPGYWQGTG